MTLLITYSILEIPLFTCIWWCWVVRMLPLLNDNLEWLDEGCLDFFSIICLRVCFKFGKCKILSDSQNILENIIEITRCFENIYKKKLYQFFNWTNFVFMVCGQFPPRSGLKLEFVLLRLRKSQSAAWGSRFRTNFVKTRQSNM